MLSLVGLLLTVAIAMVLCVAAAVFGRALGRRSGIGPSAIVAAVCWVGIVVWMATNPNGVNVVTVGMTLVSVVVGLAAAFTAKAQSGRVSRLV